MSRGAIATSTLLLAGLILWASSTGLLYYRDNFSTHYPVKSATPEIVGDGLPLWIPSVGGGQPLAGNPNYLTFYPTTLLYLLFPSHVAFNLHFYLHLVLGWFGIWLLLRRINTSRDSAVIAASLYIVSGTTISALAFYNLIVAVGLIPWILTAAIQLLDRRDLRDGFRLGLLCGLLGLAAEPVVITGVALLTTWLMVLSRADRRTLAAISLSIITSLGVAAPQIVAWLEIAAETERGVFSYSTDTALAASLRPERLGELVSGPIHGSLLDHGPAGYAANGPEGWPPLLMSVLLSALIVPALFSLRRNCILQWTLPFVVLVLLALGRYNPLLVWLYESLPLLRSFRYPEKMMLLATPLASVMIGRFLDEMRVPRPRQTSWRIPIAATIGVLAVLAISLLFLPISPPLRTRLGLTLCLQALALAVLLLPPGTRRWSLIAVSALAPLLPWAGWTFPIDRSHFYTRPSPVATALEGHRAEVASITPPFGDMSSRERYRFYAFRANPVFGVAHGASHVLGRSPEGMSSYLSRLAAERVERGDPELALRYLRIAGADRTVRDDRVPVEGTTLLGGWRAWGRDVFLFAIERPRPLVWVPRRALPAGDAGEAIRLIETPTYDPSIEMIAPRTTVLSPEIAPPRRLELADWNSQGFVLETESDRAFPVVLNQTFFSAWRAESGGEELETFPADLDRLGILVPAGRHRVRVGFSRQRGVIGSALALSLALLLYGCWREIWSSSRTAVPAR